MRATGAILLTLLVANPAWAGCPNGTTTVLSCTAKGATKALDVCIDQTAGLVSYAYGPPDGAPELSLSQTIAQVDHRPWPGIGRSIWEATVFHNAGYAYEVYISVDRMARDQPAMGGVVLYKGEETIAQVECDAGTAEIGLWAVSDAKQALGLCWDQDAQSWSACTE